MFYRVSAKKSVEKVLQLKVASIYLVIYYFNLGMHGDCLVSTRFTDALIHRCIAILVTRYASRYSLQQSRYPRSCNILAFFI